VIGREGSGARELSAKLGKRIKIINADSDLKNTIADIINPLELLGINTLFKNGAETCKIRVSKKNFAHISVDITSLEKILANLMKKQVMISFE
jgi:transcription antitermination factor NusA-like protein